MSLLTLTTVLADPDQLSFDPSSSPSDVTGLANQISDSSRTQPNNHPTRLLHGPVISSVQRCVNNISGNDQKTLLQELRQLGVAKCSLAQLDVKAPLHHPLLPCVLSRGDKVGKGNLGWLRAEEALHVGKWYGSCSGACQQHGCGLEPVNWLGG